MNDGVVKISQRATEAGAASSVVSAGFGNQSLTYITAGLTIAAFVINMYATYIKDKRDREAHAIRIDAYKKMAKKGDYDADKG